MLKKPNSSLGLHHVALHVTKLSECRGFYLNVLGMQIDWEPDADNVYFTTGTDNFALHRAPADFTPAKHQRLDHLGFFLRTKEDVDTWYEYLLENNVEIKAKPKDHRDGTRSFYFADPDGNIVQMIHFPRAM